MADNRVVIKINYDKDRKRKELIDPKMVTVWHTRRILGAIAILVFLVGLIVLWLSGEETEGNNPPVLEVVHESVPVVQEDIKATVSENKAVLDKPVIPKNQTKVSKRPPAIIFNRKVIRASLNTAPRYGEPGEPIKPLVIIEPDQSKELFYFSEVKRMKDQLMFHRWYKNGELVYKRQFKVKSDRAKLISSKEITGKNSGEWQVLLMDDDEKRFSEVNFSVNP